MIKKKIHSGISVVYTTDLSIKHQVAQDNESPEKSKGESGESLCLMMTRN